MDNNTALYASAAAIVLVTALYLYYKDNPVGLTIRISSKVPRVVGFQPFIGNIVTAIRHYDHILDLSSEGAQDMSITKSTAFLLPFSPPYIITGNPDCVEYILKDKFESFEKGSFVYDRVHEVLGMYSFCFGCI
jgi:hypothetical protein